MEKEELVNRLTVSQDLNCDFRLQLERCFDITHPQLKLIISYSNFECKKINFSLFVYSVESSMTENLRGLTEKYESLEQTLGKHLI